jgi:hypothetical protein
MRYVIYFCILFWDAAPRQNSDDFRQYVFSKYCDSTKVYGKRELRKTLRKMKGRNFEVTKIDTIYER